MSQIDADQKNTTAVIDELAAAMGRPLTDIEKLSVTAAMYQHQRDDLLATLSKLVDAVIHDHGEIAFPGCPICDASNSAKAAIAAAEVMHVFLTSSVATPEARRFYVDLKTRNEGGEDA